MNRTYKATRIACTDKYLNVHLTIEVGTALRFAEVKVPWSMVAGHYREVVDGCEQVFAEAIRRQEDHLQPRLPGID